MLPEDEARRPAAASSAGASRLHSRRLQRLWPCRHGRFVHHQLHCARNQGAMHTAYALHTQRVQTAAHTAYTRHMHRAHIACTLRARLAYSTGIAYALPVDACAVQVIQENLGIESGMITTVHNLTGTQPQQAEKRPLRSATARHPCPLGLARLALGGAPHAGGAIAPLNAPTESEAQGTGTAQPRPASRVLLWCSPQATDGRHAQRQEEGLAPLPLRHA